MSSILPHYCAHYGKLRGTQRKGRYSAVKSSQLSWAGQYKKCLQYNFKFTSDYSETLTFNFNRIGWQSIGDVNNFIESFI